MKKPVPTTKKNQTQPFSKTRFLFLVIGILIGIASGYLTTYFLKSRPQPLNLKETRAGGYKFINPLLDCDNFHTADNSKMASLKKELSNYANDALTKKKHRPYFYILQGFKQRPLVGHKRTRQLFAGQRFKGAIAYSRFEKS